MVQTLLLDGISPSASAEGVPCLDWTLLRQRLEGIFPRDRISFITPFHETAVVYQGMREHGLPVHLVGRALRVMDGGEQTGLAWELGITWPGGVVDAWGHDPWAAYAAWHVRHHDYPAAWDDGQALHADDLGALVEEQHGEVIFYQKRVSEAVGEALRQAQKDTLEAQTDEARGQAGRNRL